MDRFWHWTTSTIPGAPRNTATRTLLLEGYIAQESWFDDEITPKAFKADLEDQGQQDDIIVKIHSPGGDVFAAAQIYNMLKEYRGKVEVHVDGLAASAASVIAMAGDEVCVSPLSVVMIHNPAMVVGGEASDLAVGIQLLNEVKESIINAYAAKTSLSRTKISHLMDRETWMSAHKAIELGFADRILYEDTSIVVHGERATNGFLFDTLTVTNNLAQKLPKLRARGGVPEQEDVQDDDEAPLPSDTTDCPDASEEQKVEENDEAKVVPDELQADPVVPNGPHIDQLVYRLDLIKHWR